MLAEPTKDLYKRIIGAVTVYRAKSYKNRYRLMAAPHIARNYGANKKKFEFC